MPTPRSLAPHGAPGGVLVGRDGEMRELVTAFDAMCGGRGAVYLLTGEPGIGKTRLTEEVASQARAAGAAVLFGRCHEGEGAPAYWPWTQVVRAYLDDCEPVRVAEEMGARAEMESLAEELAAGVGLGARERRVASHLERARSSVTKALKATVARIALHHPSLGHHLRTTIRTGQFCSYTPDPQRPPRWQLGFHTVPALFTPPMR